VPEQLQYFSVGMSDPENKRSLEITRRQALKAGSVLALGGTAAILAACGGSDSSSARQPKNEKAVKHPKAVIGTLVVSNWPLYMKKQLLDDWKKEAKADLRYLEDYSDNESFFLSVQSQLRSGKPIGRDLIIPSDWAAADWIENGWAEPLDKSNIPNLKKLMPEIKDQLVYDTNQKYTVPYQAGVTGIAYNADKVTPASFADFFLPANRNKFALLASWRDTLCLYMLLTGKDLKTASLKSYLSSIDSLEIKLENQGNIQFTDSSYTKLLAANKIDSCVAWSGEIAQLQQDNPRIQFLVPPEGGMIWTDSLMIPQGARSPYGAESFMNFLYDPQVAAQLSSYTGMVSPVLGAAEFVSQQLAYDPLRFPDPTSLTGLSPYPNNLKQDELRQISTRWAKLTGQKAGQLA